MSLPLQGRYIVFPMSVRQNIYNLIHICTSTLRYIVLHVHVIKCIFVCYTIVLQCQFGQHYHDRAISLRWKVWTYQTSLALPHFIEVCEQSQVSERPYTY
jgi:hypothetical protein